MENSTTDNAAPGEVKPEGAWSTLRKLFVYLKPQRWSLIIALVLVVPEGILALLVPKYLGGVVNSATAGVEAAILDEQAIALMAVIGAQSIVLFIREYMMNKLGERVVADVRTSVHSHVLRLPLSFFHGARTGEVLSSVASDVTLLQKTLANAPAQLLRMPITLIGGLILMFMTSVRLTVVMLIAIPPLMVLATIVGNVVNKWSRKAQDDLAVAAGSFQESTAGIETVKVFCAEASEQKRYKTLIDRAFESFRRKAWIEAWFGAVVTFSIFGALIGLFWYGGRLVIEGKLAAGSLMAMLGYTLYIQGAVGSLAQVWTDIQSTLGAVGRVFELMAQPVEPRGDGKVAASGTGEIVFEDVVLRYPGAERDALDRVSFRVAPGQVCALVGPSGSGKTSIGRLLFRLFKPSAGVVSLDGVDTSKIEVGALRQTLALVSQDPVLFVGSLRENISYGRPEATDEEIIRAAKQAQIHEFILGQPDGYSTIVGERGVTLSGGQRQRIAIARAVLVNPKVLVLDEATSALDVESERLVQQALKDVRQGRTTVVIAHRISTIRDADNIIVLDRGEIVEQGRYDHLVALGGTFSRYVKFQEDSGVAAFAEGEGGKSNEV